MNLTLAFIGGMRSGKSALAQRRFSEELAGQGLRSPAYLGTLLADASEKDGEMDRRIAAHRAARPAAWAYVDVGQDLPGAAKRCLEAGHDAWLLDGLGAWASLRLSQAQAAMAEWEAFMASAREVPLLVLVLDEVGLGGVPGHPAARAFADLNGLLNQSACKGAAEVWGAQAGLAWRLK
ncbi:MAG TPA: bifunctional adenosylcobinamide kinase/adenosylcobinamide-phosphate guanylyltransferase [bacterium]|nr:bifunctional adenosylcobinamide kinase/adenosylcobinamide-phosphate guanylyltransferase [bacterium]